MHKKGHQCITRDRLCSLQKFRRKKIDMVKMSNARIFNLTMRWARKSINPLMIMHVRTCEQIGVKGQHDEIRTSQGIYDHPIMVSDYSRA